MFVFCFWRNEFFSFVIYVFFAPSLIPFRFISHLQHLLFLSVILAICFPCFPVHFLSCDQKGNLSYTGPIIRLRRIPGPARLAGFFPFRFYFLFRYKSSFLCLAFWGEFSIFCQSYFKYRPKSVLRCDKENNPSSWAGPLPSLEMVAEGLICTS